MLTEKSIENTIEIAAGNDLLTIFLNIFPLILSRFGSRASIKEGIPMVKALISVICIGINGYGAGIIKNKIANKNE